jgi:LacI family gluconate utilization system Gnt-I transcriptional repressor
MGNYLMGKGYRSFAYCCSILHKDIRAQKRYEGFKSVIIESGLPVPKIIDTEQRVADMMDGTLLKQLANHVSEFDCLYFHNDDLASAMLLTFQQLGIKIPEQIALAGFNDLAPGRFTSPRLTTTRSPRRKIGKTAAQLAFQCIEGIKLDTKRIDLGTRLIEGEST